MKILWFSNAPWLGTGYGTQTALFVPRIAEMGHDMAMCAMTGLVGQATTWNGHTVLPGGYASYSNDVLPHHARGFFGHDPGLVLILYDAWCFDPQAVRGLATAVWSPVHCKPMSHGDKMFYGLSGAQPVAMSRYGEAEMRDFGLQPAYVPHGVDTAVFRPLSAADREEARRILGVPQDAFLIAAVGANKGTSPPRKAWGEQFQAFAQFRKRHSDAVLYCHTIAASPHGLDLRPMVASLGLEGHVKFSGDYPQVAGLLTDSYVAGLMGCADVLSNPSYGEGFGIPVLEAQACGTPAVVADNSAQTELCGAGWRVECQPYWYRDDQAWWHVPLVKGIVRAWEKAYKHRGDMALREKAREFALRYDADAVATQHWKPVLEMLEQYAGAVPVRSPGRNHGSIPLPTAESDGLKWIQRGSHTDDWIATGHEENLAPHLDRLLPDGGVMVDVGAHVGRWALRMAKKASRVIAVEANPDTAAVLRAHIELNGITNTVVHNVAAWDEETRLVLDDPNHRVSGGSTRAVETQDQAYRNSVHGIDAAPLDILLGDEPRIDLVKLDVEGADLRALRGMRETLARCKPRLLIERHDIYGYYELGDLAGLLEELGYQWEELNIMLTNGAMAPYLTAEPEE